MEDSHVFWFSIFLRELAYMQVRKGHSKICQQDIIDVLDKQLLEGMGVLLTEEEQQKCEQSVCNLSLSLLKEIGIISLLFQLI